MTRTRVVNRQPKSLTPSMKVRSGISVRKCGIYSHIGFSAVPEREPVPIMDARRYRFLGGALFTIPISLLGVRCGARVPGSVPARHLRILGRRIRRDDVLENCNLAKTLSLKEFLLQFLFAFCMRMGSTKNSGSLEWIEIPPFFRFFRAAQMARYLS